MPGRDVVRAARHEVPAAGRGDRLPERARRDSNPAFERSHHHLRHLHLPHDTALRRRAGDAPGGGRGRLLLLPLWRQGEDGRLQRRADDDLDLRHRERAGSHLRAARGAADDRQPGPFPLGHLRDVGRAVHHQLRARLGLHGLQAGSRRRAHLEPLLPLVFDHAPGGRVGGGAHLARRRTLRLFLRPAHRAHRRHRLPDLPHLPEERRGLGGAGRAGRARADARALLADGEALGAGRAGVGRGSQLQQHADRHPRPRAAHARRRGHEGRPARPAHHHPDGRGRGAGELREVLVNMVFNAVDAMPEGGTLTLSTQEAGDEVVLTVADTGTGMAEEVRSRIFDPFFTTKGKAGMGLGLSVSYGIIRRHEGRVEVDSEVGRGTTFRMKFPVIGESDTQRIHETGPLPAARADGSLRILVVDDEDYVRELLADILEREGCEVVLAGEGREALSLFDGSGFDAVFTDVGLPGMSGWELSRAVRERDRAVALAVITGWGDTVTAEEQSAAQADWIVPKPFTIERIAGLVDEISQRKAAGVKPATTSAAR
ncbi:MAG: response regulator [Acidobacteria bacterium]|nr:response regulator [Acidobacteriota bacterium]